MFESVRGNGKGRAFLVGFVTGVVVCLGIVLPLAMHNAQMARRAAEQALVAEEQAAALHALERERMEREAAGKRD